MILLITIILTITFLVAHFIRDKKLKEIPYSYDTAFFVLTAVAGAFLVFELSMIMGAYCDVTGVKAEKQETYKSLVYKAETESVRDDFGILNKEYIDEIQAWNEDISYHQTLTHSIWIGVFIPNFYDDLECIDLETIQMRE